MVNSRFLYSLTDQTNVIVLSGVSWLLAPEQVEVGREKPHSYHSEF